MSDVFLSAHWSYLAMANYKVDESLLSPFLPEGCSFDYYNNTLYASLVGFYFSNTRVLGIPVPFHQHFEEVNLRFYVKKQVGDELRRGVVFVKEIVPKPMIAWVARKVYSEPYVSMPMAHTIQHQENHLSVSYRFGKSLEHIISLEASPDEMPLVSGSEAEFILEHYWGYTKNPRRTSEYRVEHPRWNIFNVTDFKIQCDFAKIYGNEFSVLKEPKSVFLAKGSDILVRKHKPAGSI